MSALRLVPDDRPELLKRLECLEEHLSELPKSGRPKLTLIQGGCVVKAPTLVRWADDDA